MAWDTGTITSAAPWAALSTKLKALVGGTGVENWSFVENIPAGTGIGQSGSTGYSIDVFRCRGASTLYKRTGQVNLCNFNSGTDTNSYVNVLSAAPGASKFITVCVINTKASAADDPTSVTLDGSNAPTFTKIKSQAGGNLGEIKMTLWIGKSSGSAPTGTNLTVAFGATETGCSVIVDQWDCCDLTLGATSVDPTGAAQIGVQVVGGNGTGELAHSATLAAYLGPQSMAVTWAAQVAASATYSAEAAWTPLAANLVLAAPQGSARGMYRPNNEDTVGVLTTNSNSGQTSWCAISFEFQRTTEATTVTSPNDAGTDYYFFIEIPVPDGAVNSSMNVAETYDGFRQVAKMPPPQSTYTPISPGGWRDATIFQYNGCTGNNRAQTTHQVLTTGGFSYWIKLTKNDICIATRVGATEAMSGAFLMDSFLTNVTDVLPLVQLSPQGASGVGCSFTRLPGVTTSVSTNAFQATVKGWTTPIVDGFSTNASAAQDIWSSSKVQVGRVFISHSAGRSGTALSTVGYARGLLKTDWLCIRGGGAVTAGDTMTISGNTWTVMYKGTNVLGGTGSDSTLVLLCRAT